MNTGEMIAGKKKLMFSLMAVIWSIAAIGVVAVSDVEAADGVKPFLDMTAGGSHMRTGWGPGLELRPGIGLGGVWQAYVAGAYVFHATDLYHNDAAGFIGGGIGRCIGRQPGRLVIARIGIAKFGASYEGRSDPDGAFAMQVGLDAGLSRRFSVGAEWTFVTGSPGDGILMIPLTLHLGGCR